MTGSPVVETPRLLLRPPTAADVDPLYEIQGDRAAMQYTWCAPDREATAQSLEAYAARFAEDGYAPWTAVLRATDRVVGWGGLNRDPSAPEWGTEVSYYIHRDHWGRGLASELVTAAIALAFGELGLDRLGAFTRPENGASARVLEKAGFRFARYVPELERNLLRLERTAWRAAG